MRMILSLKLPFLALFVVLGTTRAASDLPENLQELSKSGSSRVLEIFVDKNVRSVATVISQDGYLVTKGSNLEQDGALVVSVGDRHIQPRVVDVLPEVDLVVLKVPGKDLDHVVWDADSKAAMGDWLVSVGARSREASLGVVSAKTRKIKAMRAALGIQMQPSETEVASEGVTIVRVVPLSPAQRCDLREGDVIKEMDEKEVTNPADVRAIVALSSPGKALQIRIERNGRRIAKEALLEDETILEFASDRSRLLNGRTSTRRVDFPEVIQHDTPLDPKLMGGALLDLDGNFVGINIARVNRFTTYALPVRTFSKALKAIVNQDRSKSRTRRASLLSPAGPLGSAKTQP